MRALLAVDRVGALRAADVAAALAQGWQVERPDDELTTLPLSDGSHGLLHVLPGARREVVLVPGPLGEEVPATLARTGRTWWIDAEEVLGAHLVPGRVARALTQGSSAGLGVLLARALADGAERVVVGMGAGVVHDAGTGLVRALARAGRERDGDAGEPDDGAAAGRQPGQDTAGRREVGQDATDLDPAEVARAAELLAGVDLVLALAVDEPLTGLHGAGAQLAERYGIDPHAAQDLDRVAGRRAEAILRAAPTPTRTALPLAGTGTAGPAVPAPDLPHPTAVAGDGDDAGPGLDPHAGHTHAGHTHAGHTHDVAPREGGPTIRTEGGGAGGGSALALLALGARAFDGADVLAVELGLDAALDALDGVGVVVTSAGEVGPDQARRSVMATVGRRAATRALPVVAVGRSVTSSRRELAPVGISATAALVPGRRPEEAPRIEDPAALRTALVDRGARLARTWSRP